MSIYMYFARETCSNQSIAMEFCSRLRESIEPDSRPNHTMKAHRAEVLLPLAPLACASQDSTSLATLDIGEAWSFASFSMADLLASWVVFLGADVISGIRRRNTCGIAVRRFSGDFSVQR